MTTDPYAALGVARDASQDDIRQAYRRKAQRAHPDRKGGDAERFRAIQEAYDILSDPARRSRYDETAQHRCRRTELRSKRLANYHRRHAQRRDYGPCKPHGRAR